MAAPAVMLLTSLVGLYEGAYAEKMWKYTLAWGASTSFFIAVWFHEFWLGGPKEPDSIFGNFVLASYIAFAG